MVAYLMHSTPWDVRPIADKLSSAGCNQFFFTERGSSFGYNNLVADMRSLPQMAMLGAPVCFDATHSTQMPGARGDRTGGDREMAKVLARAAVAVGVDAVFLEVHDQPDHALSDSASQLRLEDVEALLTELAAIHRVVRPRFRA